MASPARTRSTASQAAPAASWATSAEAAADDRVRIERTAATLGHRHDAIDVRRCMDAFELLSRRRLPRGPHAFGGQSGFFESGDDLPQPLRLLRMVAGVVVQISRIVVEKSHGDTDSVPKTAVRDNVRP